MVLLGFQLEPKKTIMVVSHRHYSFNRREVVEEGGPSVKKSSRKISSTRLETWATPGIPDVLLCDEKGKFHFVELKATAGNAVDLRPHQVAWLSNHKNASVWVLVKKSSPQTSICF